MSLQYLPTVCPDLIVLPLISQGLDLITHLSATGSGTTGWELPNYPGAGPNYPPECHRVWHHWVGNLITQGLDLITHLSATGSGTTGWVNINYLITQGLDLITHLECHRVWHHWVGKY